MKTFYSYLCEEILKEQENNISPEFEEVLKQAQAAYDSQDYEKAYNLINTAETKSATEESLKSAFLAMVADKRDVFSNNIESD